MPILSDYDSFAGRHWETGSIVNALAYRGVRAPHTGQPFTEALLMGVSGGAVMGYFNFHYDGYDPEVRILTRNTFDPWDTMLSRLGIIQNIQHTGKPEKGVQNLVAALDEGHAPIVWADMWSLPYNALKWDDAAWGMMPIVVFGYDAEDGQAHIADRAPLALTVTTDELDAARARVKKEKFRVVTLDPPGEDKLASAVHLGIWDCIKLYTEAPPKGSKDNFGLQAYEWWAKNLINPRARMSWEKKFSAGRAMLSGLTNAYTDIMIFGKGGDPADRGKYADFLDEAATILDRPALSEVAAGFRQSGEAWREMGSVLLPDDVEPFREVRDLMQRADRLFAEKGAASTDERLEIAAQQAAIFDAAEKDFPLDEAGVLAHRERIADQVMVIRDIEAEAISALQAAME